MVGAYSLSVLAVLFQTGYRKLGNFRGKNNSRIKFSR